MAGRKLPQPNTTAVDVTKVYLLLYCLPNNLTAFFLHRFYQVKSLWSVALSKRETLLQSCWIPITPIVIAFINLAAFSNPFFFRANLAFLPIMVFKDFIFIFSKMGHPSLYIKNIAFY
jgi:hypothetical protein